MAAGEAQVLVKFVTKLPEQLRVPEAPVAVPATVRRYGLSRIINHMLSGEPTRPFDFLVDGELLRKSLEQHLLDRGLSAETLLEVEYVPAVAPPEQKHSAPHDDWVSAVAHVSENQVLSGSYDGTARLWTEDATCSSSFAAHSGGITSVAIVPSSSGTGAGPLALTAGKDQLVKLWRLPEQAAEVGSSAQLLATYGGHTDAVEGVTASPSGDQCASASWDGSIAIWRTGDALLSHLDAGAAGPGSQADAASKRRRVGEADGAAGTAAGGTHEAPVSTLRGHVHCVSSVSWSSPHVLYSGGWDHSVRRWDPEVGVNVDTYNGSKAVLCIATPSASSSDSSLVAFGGADRCLRVWDVRGKASGEALAVRALASHGGWVVSAAWSPDSQHHVVTASYDHSVKVWDIRTAVPLATLSQHTDKALCTAWLRRSSKRAGLAGLGRIASGGADCTLRIYGEPSEVQD